MIQFHDEWEEDEDEDEDDVDLEECPHCGRWIDDDLERCPECGGFPRPRRTQVGAIVVGQARGSGLPGDGSVLDLAPVNPWNEGSNGMGTATEMETQIGPSRITGPARKPLRVAWVYDMNACRNPTGVTRHALGQFDALAKRSDVALTAVSGRINDPDGLARWEKVDGPRRKELPMSTKDALRVWRTLGGPGIEWWTGAVEWVYAPSELFIPTRRAKLAVTSHDILQDVRFGGPRRQALLARVFDRADLVLSVSHFNTSKLVAMYPGCREKVAYVPNAAEDLFFEAPTQRERDAVRADLSLPPKIPYLISVASFQQRKNLERLVRAAGRLAEVERGELALVLLGAGDEAEAEPIRRAISALGRKPVIRLPGYRQGRALLAAYAEATALVFPSTCESFGIPAVEAMAQGIPVALADSTALPEIGGAAGWYFDPNVDEALTGALRDLLDQPEERARKLALGRSIAANYRWSAASQRLVEALRG